MNHSNRPESADATAALTVDEAAQYLRLSRSSIYRLFGTGELKARKVAGRTLVRRVDADALLANA